MDDAMTECECCEKVYPLANEVDRGFDVVCPECAEDTDFGPSDHEDRMAERRQMGLS
jgi:hypothetical protein